MNDPVYHGMTRAALDAEYDNRAKVSDFSKFLGECSALSETARSELSGEYNLGYDPSSNQTLDIIFPTKDTDGPSPLQVFIHGGYWKALTKDSFTFVARAFSSYGIATAIVDYNLIPDVAMDEIVRQCRQSVAWLYNHAGDYNIDPEKIYISGHSAGGHLVATTLCANWQEYGVPEDVVKAGTGISGLYDLEPISKCFLQDDLNLDVDTVKQNSPCLAPAPKQSKLALVVGDQEGDEYFRQSMLQHEAWPECSDTPVAMTPYNHFTIVASLADPTTELARRIRAQMQVD
jgi:arylformamidase